MYARIAIFLSSIAFLSFVGGGCNPFAKTSDGTGATGSSTGGATGGATGAPTGAPTGGPTGGPTGSPQGYVKDYLDKYVTYFADMAPLDIAQVHAGSKEKVVGDARCQKFFGEKYPVNITEDINKIDHNDWMFKEYLAGQVLTALGFPTRMACYFEGLQPSTNKIKMRSIYRPEMTLDAAEINQVKKTNVDPLKGGVKVSTGYFQPLMQYFIPMVAKWLVGETDYTNPNSTTYSERKTGVLTKAAWGFAEAGEEKKDIAAAKIMDSFYSDLGAKTLADELITEEMVLGFINQLKEFIAEHGAAKTSVLSEIMFSPRVAEAKTDFGDPAVDVEALYNHFKGQIQALIDELEKATGVNVPNGWDDFNIREKKRQELADNVSAFNIKNFDKASFRLSLLGLNYLIDPSQLTGLEALAANDIKPVEMERLENVEVNPIASQPRPAEINFAYPTNKGCYIIQGEGLPAATTFGIERLRAMLVPVVCDEPISITAADLKKKVEDAIAAEKMLFVVDFRLDGGYPDQKLLPTIFKIYEDQKAVTLPRYIVNIVRTGTYELLQKQNIITSYYKNIDGNIIKLPYVHVNKKDANNGFAGGGVNNFFLGVKSSMGIWEDPNEPDKNVNIDNLVDLVKTNATK